MNPMLKLANRLLVVFPNSVCARYWRWKLLAWYAPQHRRLTLGPDNKMKVPVRCDGKGTVIIGKGNRFGYRGAPLLGSGEILIQARTATASIVLGEDNTISNNIAIIGNDSITIGNSCQIGDSVAIYDSDFHELHPLHRRRSHGATAPVVIGNNVWLGSRSMILKGVTVGDNSVIGAMSLVTRSIPANRLAAGIPAKVIRELDYSTLGCTRRGVAPE